MEDEVFDSLPGHPYEVIDISSDEDSTDPAVIAKGVNKDKKGKKAMTVVSDDGHLNDLPEGLPDEVIDVSSDEDSTEGLEPFKGLLIDEQDDHVADTIKRYKNFKRFDIVQDYSDHHYTQEGMKQDISSVKRQPKEWSKRIQEEWKMLEKHLPDTIFVRAYEERMDLLRAVILGAQGTPYHDGLFFFDVSFPHDYPDSPPDVYYHSHGLRLNPNLYEDGYVCLSLLDTWEADDETQKWQPKLSNMLQVLVSIQGLVLNAEPYFNEPGYESSAVTGEGQKESLMYSQDAFILSVHTMAYTIRKPPKHFEEFVAGHFMTYAVDILETCKAYMDGAEVGTVVRGELQGGESDHKSGSEEFKNSLTSHLTVLVNELTGLGIKGIDKLLPSANYYASALLHPPAVNNKAGELNSEVDMNH